MRLLFLFVAVAAALPAQEISAPRIRAHTRFLSSDLMEGRGVGVRGGQLATEYIAAQFELAGLKPVGDRGTYYQQVPLVGVETQAGGELTASAKGSTVRFRWLEDFVGSSETQTPQTALDAEAVFVGHGIVAPEFRWDDYKGVDVKGKVVVLFTNEPTSTDPRFFGGKALTYYGRWTYKYEEATRRGALGCLILHTTPTAGYGWNVVRNSWGREQPYVKLDREQHALGFAGWLTSEAAGKLLALAGRNVEELLKASETRNFRPLPLGIQIRANLATRVREMDTRNVIGMVPGSDPRLQDEFVIFTAHWDHLGIGTPVNGDPIYNGAIDNATGCAMLMEMARVWAELPQKPRRSALFLAVTAEEGGLRGSEYYATHPLFPPGKTAVNINLDAFAPLGMTRDVNVGGAERTTVYPVIEGVATRMNLAIKPDAHPEQGSYYRSDHFSMARAGIPAFSIHAGTEYVGKPRDFSEKYFQEFNARDYHQPSDEFHENWDFSGLRQMAQFGFLIGLEVANQDPLPTWNKSDEFLPAREKSWGR